MHESSSFAFAEVSLMEGHDEINSLNTNKSVANSITSKQDHIDICNHFLHDTINFLTNYETCRHNPSS